MVTSLSGFNPSFRKATLEAIALTSPSRFTAILPPINALAPLAPFAAISV